MAKIKIVVYGSGKDLNGEIGIVGIVTGREQDRTGYFFARMVESEGRQRWVGQRFFVEESEALRYWKRQLERRTAA
jgi:hypothetical protein